MIDFLYRAELKWAIQHYRILKAAKQPSEMQQIYIFCMEYEV